MSGGWNRSKLLIAQKLDTFFFCSNRDNDGTNPRLCHSVICHVDGCLPEYVIRQLTSENLNDAPPSAVPRHRVRQDLTDILCDYRTRFQSASQRYDAQQQGILLCMPMR